MIISVIPNNINKKINIHFIDFCSAENSPRFVTAVVNMTLGPGQRPLNPHTPAIIEYTNGLINMQMYVNDLIKMQMTHLICKLYVNDIINMQIT